MAKTSRNRDTFNALSQKPGKRIVALVLICLGAIHIVSASGMQDASRGSALTPIQREIERQRQRLDSTEVEERRDALIRLGNLKRPDASRVAAKGLNDPIPIVRATAVHAIIHLQSEEAATLLVPLLRDPKEFVRQETAYALGETHSRSAVQPLIDALLGDKKNSVRAASAVALGQIGDEAAVVALSQVLAGGGSGDSGSKKAKKVKVSGNEFVLRAAARSLGQIRNRAAVPALIESLSSERNPTDVRREAAIALGLIGDKSARPALQVVRGSVDPYLSQIAFDSLRQLAGAKE